MDAGLEAAARALAAVDPLGALRLVARRDDPWALALRGVAMAQLGEEATARKLLHRAALGSSDPRLGARCLAAEGEVALAARDLSAARRLLGQAVQELDRLGDRVNATFARLQEVRRLLWLGKADEAAASHAALDLARAPRRLRALADVVGADLAMRALDPLGARRALTRAERAAVPGLAEEIQRAWRDLRAPVARVVEAGRTRSAGLDEVAGILQSGAMIVDACRRVVRARGHEVRLVTRPVLLALAVALGEAGTGGAARMALTESAFGVRRSTESIRVRLRVEIGRLRRALAAVAEIEATPEGYALRPAAIVLLPPAPGEASALLALLRGGESWSTSALAAALGRSQRTVQRALLSLRDDGRAEATGRGRTQRWVATAPKGFATSLLLVTHGPSR
jgi:hypothetical protein